MSHYFQAGQISYEEAILAKQQNIQERRDEARRFREECSMLMADYFSQKKEEKNEMRRLVEATAAGQHNIKEAKAKLKAMKQKIGQFVQWNLCVKVTIVRTTMKVIVL